jgi:hypothetical protein
VLQQPGVDVGPLSAGRTGGADHMPGAQILEPDGIARRDVPVLLCALKRPSTQWEEETTRAIVDWARKLTSGFGGQPPGLKPRDKGRLGRLSDPAGRNASERRAGLERNDVDADPPTKRGRLPGVGKQSTRAPAPSTGVVATACRRRVDGRQGRPGAVGIATRTSPAGDGQSGRRRGS